MNNMGYIFSGDFAIVDSVVRRYVPDLAARCLILSKVAPGNSKVLSFIDFHFVNTTMAMEMRLSFFSASEGRNGGFTAMIMKSENQKLVIDDYLMRHGRNELAKFFTYRDPQTDVRSFADTFLQMLTDLLDKDLKPIMEGKTFEVTPIDWMGYK